MHKVLKISKFQNFIEVFFTEAKVFFIHQIAYTFANQLMVFKIVNTEPTLRQNMIEIWKILTNIRYQP